MKHLLALFSIGFATVLVADDALVTEVAARQNWPWSPDVNITYRYNGANPTSVWLTATWQGQTNPVDLVTLKSTGTFLVSNGLHRLTWDPVAAGYGKDVLIDFKVQAAVTNADPRTYLIVDLVNGGYTLRPDVPEGGWTEDDKTLRMVFRRIPAGTYSLGTTEAEYTGMFGNNGYTRKAAKGSHRCSVTFTSDYYFQVYMMTSYQHWLLDSNSRPATGSGDAKPACGVAFSINSYRGATLDDGVTAVCWPQTGHQVNSNSETGRLRKRLTWQGQEELLVDLPTDFQWQLAKGCGDNYFWPTGGVNGDSKSAVSNYVNTAIHTKNIDGQNPSSYKVGGKQPNRWGIYDYCVRWEFVLDWSTDEGTYYGGSTPNWLEPKGGIDPVGPSQPTALNKRLLRGGDATGNSWNPEGYCLFARSLVDPYGTGSNYIPPRFVINLKPLVR